MPGSRKLWEQVAKGCIDADLFSLNGSWVPSYNIHKVYTGLRDAWIQTMLDTEYGGFFWHTVVDNRTVAIGGNSVREHFHDCCDFHSMVTDPEGPETCNTYNMLKLSKMLFQSSGNPDYLDYYERALYNHILSSQHPEHGGLALLYLHAAQPLPQIFRFSKSHVVLRRLRHREPRQKRRAGNGFHSAQCLSWSATRGPFADQIKRIDGQGLRFEAPSLIDDPNSEALTLKPFYELHDSRYFVYWPYADADGLESIREDYRESERGRLALERQTIDQGNPGEQQPESDNFFQGERTRAGVNRGRHWRHAEGGWFSYDLSDPYREASYLRITYFGHNQGRHFEIHINDNKIAKVELEKKGDHFYDVDYPIPAEIVDNAIDGVLTVKFIADSGSTAGGIYGVRLHRSSSSLFRKF